jgi:hypothetical protein
MKRTLLSVAVTLVILATSISPAFADKPVDFDEYTGAVISVVGDRGFDGWGYNRTARIFSGTGLSWCMEPGRSEASCVASLTYGTTYYGNDKLVMKWNAEWDRGNDEGWNNGPYDAWSDNEWNGMAPGGSGETWHYKYVWVGACGPDYTPLPEGGYCLWGQFEVIMSHGTSGGAHWWDAIAQPAGYGVYPQP